MASRYLINNGGNWTDTTKWAASDISALANINDGATPTASDDVFLTANSGQCTISATSVGKSLNCTGYTNTLTHNTFNLTISGSVTLVSGMTYTPLETAVWTIATTGTLTTGGKLLPLVILNTGITVTLGDNLSFMASKVITLTLNGNSLDINGKTVSGNSAINRVLIRSNTIGTPRTITTTTGTFDAADFRDITVSTAVNLSAATNFSGDSGGNTGITFTTAATQTYTGGTDNWSSVAKWTSRVPLPQDDVLMSGVTGGTITADMPRLGKSINWTGASGTPTYVMTPIATTIYGSELIISAMNLTLSGSQRTFEGRGAFNLTCATKNYNPTTINMIGGSLTMLDAFSASTGIGLTVTNGTFDANDFTVTAINVSSGTAGTITMGNGTWTIPGTAGNIWLVTGPLNCEGSTVLFTSINSSVKNFAGGSRTYNNFNITGGGTGAIVITGSNTFANLPQIVGGTKTLQYTAGTTTTYTGGTSFGNSTNVITISSVTAATHTLTKSSGNIVANYLHLTNSIATGGAVWYAGSHSTNNGGNTGWIFADPFGAALGGGSGKSLTMKMGIGIP